ncbi:hypothetical protein [Aminobacter sp. MET-1]|uniref:hypothetical protein n=1 Tax=Aminobacter sp. MET-1 TaxID=2951085 RepID=UPI00226AAACC|nr:hypothetical protein [Aminobacter sp. MET-1]MCX8572829.1 hypothetical protein [Aminobacter sp. MET-1]
MSRTLSCLIRRIVVAKSGKRAEDAFELIEFITTQFRQIDYIGIRPPWCPWIARPSSCRLPSNLLYFSSSLDQGECCAELVLGS